MNSKEQKFDPILINNISAALKMAEKSTQGLKTLSAAEYLASKAIYKAEQQNAALLLAQKTASSLVSILTPVDALINAQKSYYDKLHNAFSPAWKQMEAYSKFYNQTTQIARAINPILSDFIERNVRTNYEGASSFSVLEATYLETFEQIDGEIDSEILQEVTNEITNNPTLKEELITLGKAFYQAQLRDEFTDAIVDFVSRRMKINNPKVVATVIAILIILYSIWGTLAKEKKKLH